MNIMSTIRTLLAKYYGGERLVEYLRTKGMSIGENCRIFCDISTAESYLVEIGNNVTISGDVSLITHDSSIQKALPDVTDVFGKIKIGNNCFIGIGSTIMYGVTLADNSIVAAGSVVTKSVTEPGKIIGGNPAKVISDVESFASKMRKHAVNIKGLSPEQKKALLENEEILVSR